MYVYPGQAALKPCTSTFKIVHAYFHQKPNLLLKPITQNLDPSIRQPLLILVMLNIFMCFTPPQFSSVNLQPTVVSMLFQSEWKTV